MDWSKAKNVFIVIFLAVNVFLSVNIINYKMGEGISKETISSTVDILKERNVSLECDIPNKDIDPIDLAYSNSVLDRERISDKLLGIMSNGSEISTESKTLNFESNDTFTYTDLNPSGSINSLESKNVEKYVERQLKDIGLPGSDYVLDSFVSNPDGSVSALLIHEYWGFLIYNNYVDITMNKNGITYLKCRYREINNFKSPAGKKVVPAYVVLLKNFPEGSNVTITDIDFGFMEYHDKDSVNKRGYVWRVKLKGAKQRFFTAINGEELGM